MTSTRSETAVAMFEDGYSCAQSVLAVYGPGLGLDRETALRVAAPLGGGVSRTDGPCGAATGALLVLGLKYGSMSADDEDAENCTRSAVQTYLHRFEASRGCTDCTGLIGANLSEPGVPERVKEEGVTKEICLELVRTSCEILEELLDQQDQEFPA